MPMRIPTNWMTLCCSDRDPSEGEAFAYLQWLRREAALCEEYLDSLQKYPPPSDSTAKLARPKSD